MSKVVKLLLITNLSFFSFSSWLVGMEPNTPSEAMVSPLGTNQSEEIEECCSIREQSEALARLSPSRFNWIDDELTKPLSPGIHPRVGGMAYPQSVGEIRDLKALGIRLFVTLTEEPWNANLITELGPVVVLRYSPAEIVATLPSTASPREFAQAQIRKITELNLIAARALSDGLAVYLHLPVADAMGVPRIDREQVALFIQIAGSAIVGHHSAVVHCQEGVNRTGLLLNYWLRLKRGCGKSEAMRLVSARRRSITVVPDRLAEEVSHLLARLEAEGALAPHEAPARQAEPEGLRVVECRLAALNMEEKT